MTIDTSKLFIIKIRHAMKNVAILLTGHIRTYEILEEVINQIKKNIINNNQGFKFYIFLHTWKYFDHLIERNSLAYNVIDPQIINKINNFDDFSITEYHKNPILVKNKDSLFSMYLSNLLCNELKINYEKNNNIQMDLSIRLRADMAVDSPINLHKINPNNLYFTNDEFGFPDWFCISSSKNIDYYCNLINHLEDLIFEIKNDGCFGNFEEDHHNVLLKHLIRKGFGLSCTQLLNLKIPVEPMLENVKDINYFMKLESIILQIDFQYWFLRNNQGLKDTLYYKNCTA